MNLIRKETEVFNNPGFLNVFIYENGGLIKTNNMLR